MRCSLRPLALLASVCLPLACSDLFAPGQLAGTYVLQSVAGQPLPALLYSNGIDAAGTVYADTLRLAPGGHATLTEVLTSIPGPSGFHTSVDTLTYTLTFDIVALQIVFSCPPSADCAPPPRIVGHATPDGLEIDTFDYQRVPQVFTRVSAVP